MRTLNWYVTRGFLGAFFMALLILTFGMTGANMIKVLDYISRGIPVSNFFLFMLYIMPTMFVFTVPWAVMVGVMLVFGRLSADSEVTAMRACGISIIQVAAPIMYITVALTVFCFFLQGEFGPPLLGKARSLMANAALNQPLALFEAGRPFRYGGTIISIDDKEGKDTLKNVQLYTLDGEGGIGQDITAEYGKLSVDHEEQTLKVTLFNCMVIDKKSKPETRAFNRQLEFKFNYGKQMFQVLSKREKYMTTAELLAQIRYAQLLSKRNLVYETELEVELNRRFAFSLSPVAFLLLGLPMAIRTSRRETSVGLFLSVILAGIFFFSIILCNSLTTFPRIYPQYLLWLPNIVFQALGAVLTYRISKR
ncbi:MAG: LptF/LptG family permease [Victivallaceae bacterium]|nr:LptF/LptG family permease [Victivallaceae bacterium]